MFSDLVEFKTKEGDTVHINRGAVMAVHEPATRSSVANVVLFGGLTYGVKQDGPGEAIKRLNERG